VEGYRNFCNKIWNAARFVLLNTEDKDCGQDGGEVELSLADRWFMSALQRSAAEVNNAFGNYRFDLAAQEIYALLWNHYCDWYVELSKPALNLKSDDGGGENIEARQRGTRRTLVRAFETMLRLAHPFMPFITEEIWQVVAPMAGVAGAAGARAPTLMLQPYPQAQTAAIDADAEREMQRVIDIVLAIRKLRGENRVPPGRRIPVIIADAPGDAPALPAESKRYIETLARTMPIQTAGDGAGDGADAGAGTHANSATLIAGGAQIFLPLDGLADSADEAKRAARELQRLEALIARSREKLANRDFLAKAPPAVVEKERTRLEDLQSKQSQLAARN
ncbi:MAG: class I tRNA ligase family protein, partial [Gammaproteobacteria bacterium]|nr:class I tRNA ligase family protein [Gammaproteobacteria bacterium]